MDEANRTDPPHDASEAEMLAAFLEYHRETLLWKVSGLAGEQLRRRVVPSGTTLLGVVKHLAYVEAWWFQDIFAGREVGYPWTDEHPDADWRMEPEESSEDVLALYRGECDRSREILAATSSLDEAVTHPGRQELTMNRRWILVHMLEETARHVGHADILREQLDGATGE